MDMIKTAFAALLVLSVAGCTRQGVSVVHNKEQARYSSNTIVNKRINTTECLDTDDWYLDGYRVGKSFSTQKAQMLQQRVGFCQLSLKTLPQQFKTNWENGFSVGNNENIKAKNKQNRQARKKV
ncbi:MULTISPECIES: hypothetical protein [Glaesserella]|uniref:Lipoprotein n=1 Tax=Glaesserella australis TaxID=2094024 RepID=A0A328BZG5_9PAST|nr:MULTISPECIES: hypothetical protein [Glaesserella]AUI65735.1 hypothetical protein CJD39_03710 [Glaesserella sp. 15-184]RAL18981.1 hypothetical protein C5N92_04940 [Glaesserella australis]